MLDYQKRKQVELGQGYREQSTLFARERESNPLFEEKLEHNSDEYDYERLCNEKV
jgi:hypothetical protein